MQSQYDDVLYQLTVEINAQNPKNKPRSFFEKNL